VERRHAGEEPETDGARASTGRKAIYEREAELAKLSAALTAARAGAGQLVVIEGMQGNIRHGGYWLSWQTRDTP